MLLQMYHLKAERDSADANFKSCCRLLANLSEMHCIRKT